MIDLHTLTVHVIIVPIVNLTNLLLLSEALFHTRLNITLYLLVAFLFTLFCDSVTSGRTEPE